jgi:hypothetical protein
MRLSHKSQYKKRSSSKRPSKRMSKRMSKKVRPSKRMLKFGASGPGYNGPTSFTNGYANFFGAKTPYVNASEWWYANPGSNGGLIGSGPTNYQSPGLYSYSFGKRNGFLSSFKKKKSKKSKKSKKIKKSKKSKRRSRR